MYRLNRDKPVDRSEIILLEAQRDSILLENEKLLFSVDSLKTTNQQIEIKEIQIHEKHSKERYTGIYDRTREQRILSGNDRFSRLYGN